MAGIAIAGIGGVEPEAVLLVRVGRRGVEAQVLGVVVAAADEETHAALFRRQQHLVHARHRTVVQEGRRGPDALQRARFVAGDLLRQVERAETLQALLGRVVDVLVAVVLGLHHQAEQVQAFAFGQLARIERRDLPFDRVGGAVHVPGQLLLLAGEVAFETFRRRLRLAAFGIDAERLEFRGDVGEGLRRQAGHRIGIRIGIGQGEFGQATERQPGGFAAGDHADQAITRVAGEIAGEQRREHAVDFLPRDAGGRQIETTLDESRGCRGIGADMRQRHYLDLPLFGRRGFQRRAALLQGRVGHVRAVAHLAMRIEQFLALRGECLIDLAEQFLRPRRRLQALQVAFDAVEIGDIDRGVETPVRRQRIAVGVGQAQHGADAERFADIARQRLAHRTVVLHPVEFPDVPQVGITHRRGGVLVILRNQVIAEHGIGDAAERIGAAETFAHRIELAQRVVLPLLEQGQQRGAEGIAQLRFPGRITRADHATGETVELERIEQGLRHRRDQGRAEGAAFHAGEGVHGLAAVDADGDALAVLLRMDLAGVAGRAGDVEHVLAQRRFVVLGEADRQLVGIGRRRMRIDDEAIAPHVVGIDEALLAERQFEIDEPAVAHRRHQRALRHGGALRRVVVGLAIDAVGALAPALVEIDVFVYGFFRRNRTHRPEHEGGESGEGQQGQDHGRDQQALDQRARRHGEKTRDPTRPRRGGLRRFGHPIPRSVLPRPLR